MHAKWRDHQCQESCHKPVNRGFWQLVTIWLQVMLSTAVTFPVCLCVKSNAWPFTVAVACVMLVNAGLSNEVKVLCCLSTRGEQDKSFSSVQIIPNNSGDQESIDIKELDVLC